MNNIKLERTKQKLTQQELADLVGLTKMAISYIERDVYNKVLLKNASAIAKVLKVSIIYLFKLE